MKKLFFYTLLSLLIFSQTWAQSPEGFKYQAVIRNTHGEPIKNKAVQLRISILKSDATGQVVYSEIHQQTTNSYGLVVLNIGMGQSTDEFSAIDWGADKYFLKAEINSGNDQIYSELGTSQLLSVPYALYAKTAGKLENQNTNDYDPDPANELQNFVVSLVGDTLYLTKGNWVIVPGISVINNKLTVNDIDGNVYGTVVIGNQVWMAGNLQVTRFSDGTNIPLAQENNDWGSVFSPAYCAYGNIPYGTYGLLYNFYAVETGKLCPTGWHVPTDAEWTILTDNLGGSFVAGNKLKMPCNEMDWYCNTPGATNEAGFYALPGGFRNDGSYFEGLHYKCYFWTSTDDYIYDPLMYSSNSYYRYLLINSPKVESSKCVKSYGFSVRCIKD